MGFQVICITFARVLEIVTLKIMRKFYAVLVVVLCAGVFMACEKEKKSTVNNILVPPHEEVVPDTIIHKMNVIDATDTAHWLGSVYQIDTHRFTSDSLSYVTDNNGKRVRNNIIHVIIKRKDGSVFFDKKFTKSAFEPYLDKDYLARSVLLGLVYNGSEKDIELLGSVGNPDILTEEFVPFNVHINKLGEVRIEKAAFKIPDGDSTMVNDNEGV